MRRRLFLISLTWSVTLVVPLYFSAFVNDDPRDRVVNALGAIALLLFATVVLSVMGLVMESRKRR